MPWKLILLKKKIHINMKATLKIIAVLLIIVSFNSCQKNSRPNYQYMPNMYEPVGYETYMESTAFNNGVEAQIPAAGTIELAIKTLGKNKNIILPFEVINGIVAPKKYANITLDIDFD